MASYRDRLPVSGGSSTISVQRTISAVTAAGLTNVSITAVNTAKTYLNVSVRPQASGSSNPRDMWVSVRLKDATTIEIKRPAGASTTVYPIVTVEVVSDSGCSVIRGVAGSIADVTIPAINTAKSFCRLNGINSTQSSTSLSYDYIPIARITSSTTIQVSAVVSVGSTDISWEAISYV